VVMIVSGVSRFPDWLLLSCWMASEVPRSQPTWFLPVGTPESQGVPEKIREMNRLKERIQNTVSHRTPDVLTRVHHEWESCIHMCFQSDGNHIENILWIKIHFVKKC
jgi:hypothetical protein